MRKLFVLLCTLPVLFTACNLLHCPNKEAFLESYSEFVDGVETMRLEQSEQWSDTDEAFRDYTDRCYKEFKDELTVEEKKLFWKKTIKYYYNRYNGRLNDAYKDAKEKWSEDFQDDFEQMLKDADEDVAQMMQELFSEDIKQGIDSFLEVINELGEELKESLDKEKK